MFKRLKRWWHWCRGDVPDVFWERQREMSMARQKAADQLDEHNALVRTRLDMIEERLCALEGTEA